MPQDARGGNGDDDIKTEIPMQKILAGAALKAACEGVKVLGVPRIPRPRALACSRLPLNAEEDIELSMRT
ncbi:hypothetical protein [Rhizobium laguerreae]|uniref:hypothetical protein n=1 Tax=Rhizobium laguerreae TaxID=1076926 RepID=UPI001FE3CEC2|nr:hypothetical protein [Rhizobium laguerreae]